MFEKKIHIPVQHYEGLQGIPQDYPCKIEVNVSTLIITSNKAVVTLPTNRIKSYTAIEEERFMVKYHGEAKKTGKSGIKKYYLVVDYVTQEGQPGMLAFWGTSSEYGRFLELQNTQETPQTYSL